MLTDPDASGPTLAELSAASGQEARTIRSWIAQGLLPPPLNRGPAARYPADTLQRLLAIVVMRELLGMSLADIRLDLLSATPDRLELLAKRFAEVPPKPNRPATDPRDALDYLAALKSAPAPQLMRARKSMPMQSPTPAHASQDLVQSLSVDFFDRSEPSKSGLAELEARLGGPRPQPQRRPRTEEWLRIQITPDLELAARGKLEERQRRQLESIATLIRTIITGG